MKLIKTHRRMLGTRHSVAVSGHLRRGNRKGYSPRRRTQGFGI